MLLFLSLSLMQAYNTAVALRKIVNNARGLMKNLCEAMKKCKALTNPDDRKKCYQELMKQAVAEGKPIWESYKNLRPTILDVMNKFDKCMAV